MDAVTQLLSNVINNFKYQDFGKENTEFFPVPFVSKKLVLTTFFVHVNSPNTGLPGWEEKLC
jgi:hypothetical protein